MNQLSKPTYDRSLLQAGIVHIGVGNFHRAHLSWYLHRLMQKGMDHELGYYRVRCN
jgi:mannitol 2-dehydrogenase